VTFDWYSCINFTLQLTTNRTLGNPSNGQAGTWRTILVSGNDSTNRTLSFDSNYGDPPSLTDIDDAKWYLISIHCVGTSHFVVSAMDGSPP
jgi:hypothetical protein